MIPEVCPTGNPVGTIFKMAIAYVSCFNKLYAPIKPNYYY